MDKKQTRDIDSEMQQVNYIFKNKEKGFVGEMKKVRIAIDLGNSQTRVALLDKERVEIIELDNNFALIGGEGSDQVNSTLATYASSDASFFFIHDKEVYGTGRVMAEYAGRLIRPVAVRNKTEQLVTSLTIKYAILKALEVMGIEDEQVTVEVSALLPPLEYKTSEDALKSLIRDLSGKFVGMRKSYEVEVVPSRIFPEEVTGYIGALYQEYPVGAIELAASAEGDILDLVPENEKYLEGLVLTIGLGAGTINFSVISDGAVLENSLDTIKKGGNNIIQSVKNLAKVHFGFNPSDVSKALSEGILVEGSLEHNAVGILEESKRKFSEALANDTASYLEGFYIDPKEIKGILIHGGCSIPAHGSDGCIVSPSVGKFLLNYLKEIIPNALEIEFKTSPRLLNIYGLAYIVKYM